MCKRLVLIAILLLGVGVMSVSETDAGTGFNVNFKPQGIECTASGKATGPGDKTLGCGGTGVCIGGVTDDSGVCSGTRSDVLGELSCENHGGNFAVGNNPEPIQASSEGTAPLTEQNIKKGKFTNQIVVAFPDQPTLDALTPFCPTSANWTAFDFAFCNSAFEATGELTNANNILGQTRAVCELPCTDVSFIQQTGTFTGPPYQCQICPKNSAGDWDCSQCVVEDQSTPGIWHLGTSCSAL